MWVWIFMGILFVMEEMKYEYMKQYYIYSFGVRMMVYKLLYK